MVNRVYYYNTSKAPRRQPFRHVIAESENAIIATKNPDGSEFYRLYVAGKHLANVNSMAKVTWEMNRALPSGIALLPAELGSFRPARHGAAWAWVLVAMAAIAVFIILSLKFFENKSSDNPPSTVAGGAQPLLLNLNVDAISSSTIRLTWDNQTSSGQGQVANIEINNGVETRFAPAGATSFDWKGLHSGEYMCFRVRADSNVIDSPWSPDQSPWYVCTTTP